ncbi:unnamed protein product [Brassica oleracea]
MASLHDCITEILVLSLLITSSISSTSAVTVGSHVRFPECRGEIVCEDQGTTSAAAVEVPNRSDSEWQTQASSNYKINTDESPNTTNRYGIRSVPTVIIFKDGGACGYDNPYHAGFGAHTAALSGALFKSGESCGGCYQVWCDYRADPKWCLRGAAVTVTATNFCPSNNNGGWCNLPRHHFDMSMPAFFRIARRGNEGIVPVFYRRVGCRRRGGVRFTMRGQGTFNMVILSNVGGSGAVKAVAVRGSRGKIWHQMTRNWGANWQSSGDLRGQRLSFRVTLLDCKTMTFLNIVPSSWWFGQTFSSRGQFH